MARMAYSDYAKKGGKGSEKDYDAMDDDSYEKACSSLKKQDDDEDEDMDDEEEEKSMPNEDDLIKALRELEAFADELDGGDTNRQDVLLAKAQSGTLDNDEAAELAGLLQGTSNADDGEGGLHKSLTDNDVISDAFDASEFLAAFGESVSKSVDALASDQRQRDVSDARFKKQLAKSLHGLTERIVGIMGDMRDRVAHLEGQPSTPWRSVPSTPRSAVVEKGQDAPLNGAASQASQLNKGQAMAGFESMMLKSTDAKEQQMLGDIIMRIESFPGDWRRVPGISPELAGQMFETLNSAA